MTKFRPLRWRAPFAVMPRLLAGFDVDETSGCWVWRGSTSAGYAQIGVNGTPRRAHVISFWLHKGINPSGLVIRHVCDNKRCVNPEHLVSGSHADNMRDMVVRDRSPRGARHGCAKLSERDVVEIRSSSAPARLAAKCYGVSRGTISDIRRRRSWSHV